jgi:phosphoglycerate dehydrogenase-like enzyme
MAEYAIGALAALRQRFLQADRALRDGVWRFGFFGEGGMIEELFGSTLGIIGFGSIGAEVARRANAFGIRCRSVTLHPDKPIEPGLLTARPGALDRAGDVDDLVSASDAIVVACEHSPLTEGLIAARRFSLMRRTALLVNVARGPIVEERALYEALKTKDIAGAAIDVWYRYPEERTRPMRPSEYPFEELDNVLMTPHSSAWTAGTKRRRLEFLAGRINDWYEHRRPR